jgi:hypothetical protein
VTVDEWPALQSIGSFMFLWINTNQNTASFVTRFVRALILHEQLGTQVKTTCVASLYSQNTAENTGVCNKVIQLC